MTLREETIKVLRDVLTAGNHAASQLIARIGPTFPDDYPPSMDPEDAINKIGDTTSYDFWVLWSTAMNARSLLSRLEAGSGEETDEVGWWHYSINYGPDGEENYANVYTPTGKFVGNLRISHARDIVGGLNAAKAARPHVATPAPGENSERADLDAYLIRAAETAKPVAWARGVHTPSSPYGPGEYDLELCAGDDPPDGDGWCPLFSQPHVVPVSGGFDQWRIGPHDDELTHALINAHDDYDGTPASRKAVLRAKQAIFDRIVYMHEVGFATGRRSGLEEAAKWHDDEIAALDEHIESNNRIAKQRSGTIAACITANDECRREQTSHRLAAAAIRAIPEKQS